MDVKYSNERERLLGSNKTVIGGEIPKLREPQPRFRILESNQQQNMEAEQQQVLYTEQKLQLNVYVTGLNDYYIRTEDAVKLGYNIGEPIYGENNNLYLVNIGELRYRVDRIYGKDIIVFKYRRYNKKYYGDLQLKLKKEKYNDYNILNAKVKIDSKTIKNDPDELSDMLEDDDVFKNKIPDYWNKGK